MSNTAQNYTIPVVGHFSKVSLSQFKNAMKDEFGVKWSDEEIEQMWNDIKLPTRATVGSAGYDFFSPIPFTLKGWEDIKIPTGIRAVISNGWYLTLMPRSSMGFKNYLRFANICPVVDSDYSESANEGHIWAKVRTEKDDGMTVAQGAAFSQGIFVPYGIADDDEVTAQRNGGLGSTSR